MRLIKPFFLTIVNDFYKNSKPYSVLLLLLTFLFSVFLSFSCLDAKAASKPKLQSWQIESIGADTDDSYPLVKLLALKQLAEGDPQDLKSVVEKGEYPNTNDVNIVQDKSVGTQTLKKIQGNVQIEEPCNALCSYKYRLVPSGIEGCVRCCRGNNGKICQDSYS
jgi:hypothetical protein